MKLTGSSILRALLDCLSFPIAKGFPVAAILSLFCPGLGHLVLGKPVQALLWFVLAAVGYVAFVVPGLVVHLIAIVDAARAERRRQLADTTAAIRAGVRR